MLEGLLQKLKWAVILWLARRLPDCKQMTRNLGESLDRETSWRERLVMKLHLFTCEACERYLDQLSFLKHAVHIHGDPEAGTSELSIASMSPESKVRLKTLLRQNIGLAF
jgi:hypothetical protein